MNYLERLNTLKARAVRATDTIPPRQHAEFTPAARAIARAAVLEVLG